MKVYTVRELAEILRLSEQSVKTLIHQGKLKSLDTNGAIRVSETQLSEYLEGK